MAVDGSEFFIVEVGFVVESGSVVDIGSALEISTVTEAIQLYTTITL
jgi:hypothetical protein